MVRLRRPCLPRPGVRLPRRLRLMAGCAGLWDWRASGLCWEAWERDCWGMMARLVVGRSSIAGSGFRMFEHRPSLPLKIHGAIAFERQLVSFRLHVCKGVCASVKVWMRLAFGHLQSIYCISIAIAETCNHSHYFDLLLASIVLYLLHRSKRFGCRATKHQR